MRHSEFQVTTKYGRAAQFITRINRGCRHFLEMGILQNFSVVIFTDFYWELQLTNIFNAPSPGSDSGFVEVRLANAAKFGLERDIGFEAGLEFNLWKQASIIGKLRLPLVDPDNFDDVGFTLSIVSHFL